MMPGHIHTGKLFDRPRSVGDPTIDHQLWQTLKPYVGQCLTLNHEINNPLTALLGYIDILLLDREGLSVSQLEYLRNVQQAAMKIQSVARNLSKEKIELAEKVDLQPIVEAYTRLERNHNK